MREQLPTRAEIGKLPPDGGPEFNRLIFETSPYLLQHARNPVDWYPWGEEAFARARAEDRPIFLSVGYATCHWCHVMARESFEDEETARVLNEHFVAIKVDREERPDIDELYMTATQLMTGAGGWPMSVWLTPDGRPWYAGTYFPPASTHGLPGFRDLLQALAETWRTRRAEVEAQADQICQAIRSSARSRAIARVPLSLALLRGAVEALSDNFDERFGGFGDAPKFPPHATLRLLLFEYRRSGEERALEMARKTMDAMARGGIHDHVGGGFHRYATDRAWLVPHFEKMLYDNAQLARSYAELFAITGEPEHARTARRTCEWVLREMTEPGGGFYAALDADSEGVEGKFYQWTRAEVMEVLGEEAGALFADIFHLRDDGDSSPAGAAHATTIPHLSRIGPEPELWPWIDRATATLRTHRDTRVRPLRDEQVLAAWNGLMIGGLATAGRLLDEPGYLEAAARAAEFVLTHMRADGRLLHVWCDGAARVPGYLDDYAFLAEGLLDLHAATGDARWLEEARALADAMLELFGDEGGGFFFTAEDTGKLLARFKRPFDGATPAGNGVAALVLVRLAAITGEARYMNAARATLETFSTAMRNVPTATGSLLLATGEYLALVGESPTDHAGDATEEGADTRVTRGPLTVEAWASARAVRPGDDLRVAVRIEIAEGWHINSHDPRQDYLAPTKLVVLDPPDVGLREVRYPEGVIATPDFTDEALSVYRGEVWLVARLAVADDAAEGPCTIHLELATQACDDTHCGAPERHLLELPLRIDAEAAPERRHSALFARFEE